MGCRLLFPGLLRHIQEATGLPAKEELEGGEASGGLGNFADPEEDVGDHEVPVALVLRDHPSQHLLQSLIEAFDQSVGLGMVDGGPQLLHPQQPAEVSH